MSDDPSAEAPEPGRLPETRYRQRYEAMLHDLSSGARVELAHQAEEPDLSALCFDPVSAVIAALFENSRAGLLHARLVARHHRTPQGLDVIMRRGRLAGDSVVRRELLRNPQLPMAAMHQLLSGRPMLEAWTAATSREMPEQNRRGARDALRVRFTQGPAEERVDLIMRSEGRCLALLTGIAIDSKTTALLCGRTFNSTLFIQNLARWGAAPPALIAHLLRQEVVRRSPPLRTALRRHPNAPGPDG